MAANQIVFSHGAGTGTTPDEMQIVHEAEILSHKAGTGATPEETQIVHEAEILSHEAGPVAALEETQIVHRAQVLSYRAGRAAAPEVVQVVNQARSPTEARLTIYHPTNLPREGEVLFGQDGEVFYGSPSTIPQLDYFQVAGVPPTPFQEVVGYGGPQPYYLQVPEVPPAPLITTPPTRCGTGYYLPRYHFWYHHRFNCRGLISMESNEESAIPEEGMTVNEGQAVTASEYEDAKPGSALRDVHSKNKVKAAQEEIVVNQAEEVATPEGEKTLNEAKAVAAPEEEKKETEAVADPEQEKIVQEAQVPTGPKKDNSRKRQKDRKEQAALREAAAGGVSVAAGAIRAPENEKNVDVARVVPSANDFSVINEAEWVTVPQEEVIANLAKVLTGHKKSRPMQKERMIEASTTVVHGEPGASALLEEKIIIEQDFAAPEEEKVVIEAEAVAVSGNEKQVLNQAKAAIRLKKGKGRLKQRERMTEASTTVVYGKPGAVVLLEEKNMIEEALAAPEEEKVVIEAEAFAVFEEDKQGVNQAKAGIGLKKGKARVRQRERKREAALKESVRTAAGEKQQKGREISHMKHVWRSVKEVPSFIKHMFDKIVFQIASLTARITGYDRTPKKILKLRAELEKKVGN